MRPDVEDLTRKTVEIRQKLVAVLAGQETEPAYNALLEILSTLIIEANNPLQALGSTVVTLTNYMLHKGAIGTIEVTVEGGDGHDPEHDQSLN